MITRTNWVDPQGTSFDAPVFEISMATLSSNTYSNFDFRISEGFGEESKYTEENKNSNLDFELYYWKDQASFDAGALPYIMANLNPMGTRFYVSSDELQKPEYDGLTAYQAATHYVENVLLAE